MTCRGTRTCWRRVMAGVSVQHWEVSLHLASLLKSSFGDLASGDNQSAIQLLIAVRIKTEGPVPSGTPWGKLQTRSKRQGFAESWTMRSTSAKFRRQCLCGLIFSIKSNGSDIQKQKVGCEVRELGPGQSAIGFLGRILGLERRSGFKFTRTYFV